MKKILALAAIAFTSMFATFAYADDISLGQPGYGGTGCPSGSVSATLSPDSKSLSLLFDSYLVQAGGTAANRSTARAATSPFRFTCRRA